jgi:hypothetical protein
MGVAYAVNGLFMLDPHTSVLFMRIDDDALDFLAGAMGEQILREVARTCRATETDWPTVPDLTALAETISLQTAVAELDRQKFVADPKLATTQQNSVASLTHAERSPTARR